MATILVQTQALKQKIKTIFVPTALALLVSACSSVNPVTESIKQEAYGNSEFYINKADQAKEQEDKQSYRLLAVRKLIEENKAEEAKNTFAEITGELTEPQKLEYALTSAQLSAMLGQNEQAVGLLKNLPMPQLSQAQLLRYYQTEARLAENRKDVIDTVRAKVMMDNYLTDNKARQQNNDEIWQLLREGNRGMIEKATPQAGEVGLAGWLALANLYNQNMSNPAQIKQGLNQWKQQYPNHSAATLMPKELQDVANYQQTNLNSIAFLLPLSGEAKVLGEILKKGFDEAKGDDPTVVQVFDTDSDSVANLITKAKEQGVQTIIGPLLKPRVDEMLLSPEINGLNVLALNATDNVKNLPQVCYYGLSPESEAKAAAERLYRDGVSRAVVAAPQTDFGQRSADAFVQEWRKLTRTDADVRYYNQPLDAVAAIQNNGVAQGSGLYMLGTAEEVLQIKQGIDQASLKLPMYTSSRSNSPNNDSEFFTAMEGVKFSEIPLLADTDSEMYQKSKNLAEGDFSMMRLYAMGSDAWALANKFNELRQISGYSVSGLTGNLTKGKNCNVERGMSWLQYRNGAVETAY